MRLKLLVSAGLVLVQFNLRACKVWPTATTIAKSLCSGKKHSYSSWNTLLQMCDVVATSGLSSCIMVFCGKSLLLFDQISITVNELYWSLCPVFKQSTTLFRLSCLSVHPFVRSFVCPSVRHKKFFSLKSPWNHPLTPGVDPRGWPWVPLGHPAPPEELEYARQAGIF